LADNDCHALITGFKDINVRRLPDLLSTIIDVSGLGQRHNALNIAASVFAPRDPTTNAGFLVIQLSPQDSYLIARELERAT